VLDALVRTLEPHVLVERASSAAEALDVVRRKRPFLAAFVDLALGGTSGVNLLLYLRVVAPEAVRILVAGSLDLDLAAVAVNQAEVFRILSWPASPDHVLQALEAANEEKRRDADARERAGAMQAGCVEALQGVLEYLSPAAVERTRRVRALCAELAPHMKVVDQPTLLAAASCSQLGCITLPSTTLERLYYGETLNDADRFLAERLPQVRDELLARVPGLEAARAVLLRAERRFAEDPESPPEARALRIALDYDLVELQGADGALVLDTLRGRSGFYDPGLLEALGALRGNVRSTTVVRELPVRLVGVGMVFAEDVRTKTGSLLIARGHQATPGVLDRIRHFRPGSVHEPIRMIVRSVDETGA
jgi:ActR/RegA family two-component response regulator